MKIKDIFRVTRGSVLAADKVLLSKIDGYEYPVYSSQTKADGLLGYYNTYLYENAITWTTDGANAGTVHYRAGKFYCTNVCGVLLNKDGYANRCTAAILGSISKKYVSYVGNPKLMNNIMSEIPIIIPALEEQHKIDSFIAVLDKRIKAQQMMITSLKKYKRGVIQRVFSGRKGNGKDHCPTWEVSSFGEFFTEQIIKTSNSPDTPLVSLTVEDGITPKTERYYREFLITKEGDNYKAIKPGWFAYNPMNAHLGAIAANHLGYTAAVSGYYNIFSANETDTISFWEEYLTSYPMLIHYKLIATGSLIEKQRVHYSQFVGIRRCLPSVEEQKHLSKLFEAVNKKIANAESMERQLVRMRVSLLQQLFI